jgi:hypothetical protein
MILIVSVEAMLMLMAVYFEPTFTVCGVVEGEAFFEGRSATYWRHELEHWEVESLGVWVDYFGRAPGDSPPPVQTYHMFTRRTSRWDEWWTRWGPQQQPAGTVKISYFSLDDTSGPKILQGNPESAPVLRELQQCGSVKVREMARIGLERVNRKAVKTP